MRQPLFFIPILILMIGAGIVYGQSSPNYQIEVDVISVSSIGAPGTVSDTEWKVKGIADFDGNGKADIFWQHATSGWTAVWLMDGAVVTSVGAPGMVGDLLWKIQCVGDFDGDGKMDVMWQHETSGWTYIWFLNGATVTSTGVPGVVSDFNWQIVN